MKSDIGNMENRLRVLEEKLEYQDYTMDTLNDVLVTQQRQISKLEDEVHSLRQKMDVLYDDSDGEQPVSTV